jgi:hypothetical protein
MLSDDVYRAQLGITFDLLKRRVALFSDVAEIDSVSTPDFVRLSIAPRAIGACPVEIMLRADQLYDISIGVEFYEDCPVRDFALFEPLIVAISQGAVVQRHHISMATGTERSIETIVTLADGEVWRKGHLHADVARAIADNATLFSDRRFVPYRRA